jgi:LysR family transcriptional regulator, low CO2-responsive transcriptional regulator
MRFTWNQLRMFEALARHASFTRAARELHVVQPTVSAQIRQLSDAVDIPLYEQFGKKIQLTEAGLELQRTVQELNDAWNRFEMKISDLKGVKAGRLRLAVVTTTKYFVPRLLAPFCNKYPGIDVSLEIVNRDRVLERLNNNLDDLYILGILPKQTQVESRRFLDNPLLPIAAKDHPLAAKRDIPLERLADERFILREPGSGTRIATEEFFDKRKLKLKIKMELGNNEAIKWAVAGGLGLSVVSQHSLLMEPMHDRIAVLDVQGFPIRQAWHLVYPTGKKLSIIARTFFDYLVEESKTIQAELDQARVKSGRRWDGGN